MKNPKIGDVVEIKTKDGFFYAQYTHHHPDWNAVIQVFDTSFQDRPSNWKDVVKLPVRFMVFFPLRSAVRQNAIKIVAHEAVEESRQSFPLFRNGVADPKTGKVNRWYLWDGLREYVADLPAHKMKPLSHHWSVDILYLEQLLETGWTPEKDWDEKNFNYKPTSAVNTQSSGANNQFSKNEDEQADENKPTIEVFMPGDITPFEREKFVDAIEEAFSVKQLGEVIEEGTLLNDDGQHIKGCEIVIATSKLRKSFLSLVQILKQQGAPGETRLTLHGSSKPKTILLKDAK